MALMVIGVAAALCASTMAVPQAWRCIRSRQSDGVSPLTWYLIIANAGLWILWGAASHDYIAGIPSVVTLPAASIVVVRSHLSRKGASHA